MASGIDIFELYNSLPDEYKEKGKDKVKSTLNKRVIAPLKQKYIPKIEEYITVQINGSNLSDNVKPEIIDLAINQVNNPRSTPDARALAIEKAKQRVDEEAQKNLSNLCLSPSNTQKLLDLRNKLVNDLNKLKKVVDPINQVINASAFTVNTSISTVKSIRTAKTALDATISAQAAAGLPPSPIYLNLQNLVNAANTGLDLLRFDEKGNSKLNDISEFLDSVAIPIGIFGFSITKVVNLLSILDLLIVKCDPKAELNDVDSLFIGIATAQNNADKDQKQPIDTFYKGFNLSIEEEPSATYGAVKRRRAVAKNSQGITLVFTPYSFTTNDQTLIQEIKTIIDGLRIGNTQQL